MGGSRKVLIATAASSSTSHHEAIAGVREIVEQFTCIVIVDDGSHGNRSFGGRSFAPAAIAAFAVTPALARVLRIKPEMKQRVVVLARHQHDVTAASAVTAAGTAARDILLAPEGHAAVAAVAGFDGNINFVYKH